MKLLSSILLTFVAMALVGCRTAGLAGDYSTIAKHSFCLHLNRDGTYATEDPSSVDSRGERGRWYSVQEDVVMLVPEDTSRPQWFARVANRLLFIYSEEARAVLRPSPKH